MTSSRDRDDPLTFPSNPSSSSSPISVSDHLDSYLQDPSSSHIGSAAGSYHNEGLLGGETVAISDAEFGFSRPDFLQDPLAGTVQFYQRHVFLCYKNPAVWPPRIEATEFDRLPRLLSAAVMARKGDMRKETRLTICMGHDGTETSNGDVLIFPDMIRYRRLTHFDVETFVEEVLVKDGEWLPGTPEALKGSFIFVCSHGSRDRRCGVCGPPLVSRFKEEIELHGLQDRVSVSPCSHIGGHEYAGNVIIFGSSVSGEVTGHWYGYVTSDDVPTLLEQHVEKGQIVDWLWRGQMGLSEEEQKTSQELRLELNSESNVERSMGEATEGHVQEVKTICYRSQGELNGCCQENGSASCGENPVVQEKANGLNSKDEMPTSVHETKGSKKPASRVKSSKGASVRRVCATPTWLESWEREDTYATLAVVFAAISVAVAYSCCKRSS